MKVTGEGQRSQTWRCLLSLNVSCFNFFFLLRQGCCSCSSPPERDITLVVEADGDDIRTEKYPNGVKDKYLLSDDVKVACPSTDSSELVMEEGQEEECTETDKLNDVCNS